MPGRDRVHEPKAQLERLRYMLEQGVKEGLVPHPTKWPGVQSASPWLEGTMKIPGIWVDRSQLYDLERAVKGRKVKAVRRWLSKAERKRCEESLDLELTPLPCLQDLSESERKQLVANLCDDIVDEHQEKIGRITKGWRKRLMDPKLFAHRPQWTKKGHRPKVHAATEASWICWMRELEAFLSRYDRASRRLRAGIAEALYEFPEGCFIPTGICGGRRHGLPPPLKAS